MKMAQKGVKTSAHSMLETTAFSPIGPVWGPETASYIATYMYLEYIVGCRHVDERKKAYFNTQVSLTPLVSCQFVIVITAI